MVSAGGQESGVDYVFLFRQVTGVRNHDGESNGKTEEYLPICGDPDRRFGDRGPVRCEHVSDSLGSSRKSDAAEEDDYSTDQQDRQTDFACQIDALVDSSVHDEADGYPDDNEWDDQGGVQAAHLCDAVGDLQHSVEASGGIFAPPAAGSLADIAQDPYNNCNIVD